MTTTPSPSPEAVDALEIAIRNAEAWHADTQYKAGYKDVAEVCIELLNKAGFTITRAAPMSEAELEVELLRASITTLNGYFVTVETAMNVAKKYRGES